MKHIFIINPVAGSGIDHITFSEKIKEAVTELGIADYEMLEAIRAAKGDEVADALLAKVIHIAEVKDFYDDVRCKPSAEMFSMKFEDYNALKAEMLQILSE